MAAKQSVKDKILDAAMQVMSESGVKNLTQTKVAEVAGVRQSHLTYYFPKKIDLVIGLMQGHIDYANQKLAAIKQGAAPSDIGGAMDTLVSDRKRMRFFLGLIIEADQDPRMRKLVYAHVKQFNALVAHYYGRAEDDKDVIAFLNTLRGYGMMNLLRTGKAPKVDVQEIADTFGLSPHSLG